MHRWPQGGTDVGGTEPCLARSCAGFTRSEIRRELEAQFDVQELTGIRNIPARSIAGGLAKARLGTVGDRFLGYMTDRGHAADFWLESTPPRRRHRVLLAGQVPPEESRCLEPFVPG